MNNLQTGITDIHKPLDLYPKHLEMQIMQRLFGDAKRIGIELNPSSAKCLSGCCFLSQSLGSLEQDCGHGSQDKSK